MPSHYLNQCWNIVNWTLGNQLQRNFNLNSNIFTHENGFESVVCEMAAILSWPQCVKLTPEPKLHSHSSYMYEFQVSITGISHVSRLNEFIFSHQTVHHSGYISHTWYRKPLVSFIFLRPLELLSDIEGRLLYNPSLVAVGLSVGYETWSPIDCHCLSCNALWVHMTGGNFHHFFQRLLTVPLHSPQGLPLGLSKGTVKESRGRVPNVSWAKAHNNTNI